MHIYDIETISQQNPITKDCKTPPNKLTNIAAGIVHVFTLPKYDKITNIAIINAIINWNFFDHHCVPLIRREKFEIATIHPNNTKPRTINEFFNMKTIPIIDSLTTTHIK